MFASRAGGEARSLAESMPRLILEARKIAATVIHGLHGRKRAGTALLRACHVLSAMLFAYFAYSVIVNGYHDLILKGAQTL